MDVNYRFLQKHWQIVLVLVLVLMLAAGCSGKNDKEILKERALKYWTLKSEKKVKDMYDFESPNFKKMVSPEQYLKYYKLVTQYEKPQILDVIIDHEGESADVKLKIIAGVRPPGFKNTFRQPVTITDQWVKGSDDIWYHVPTKSIKGRK